MYLVLTLDKQVELQQTINSMLRKAKTYQDEGKKDEANALIQFVRELKRTIG